MMSGRQAVGVIAGDGAISGGVARCATGKPFPGISGCGILRFCSYKKFLCLPKRFSILPIGSGAAHSLQNFDIAAVAAAIGDCRNGRLCTS
jgi:hypothetical protein